MRGKRKQKKKRRKKKSKNIWKQQKANTVKERNYKEERKCRKS